MNPYNNFQPYIPPYMQQPQAQTMQHVPQPTEPKVVTYSVETVEQMAAINPMPNTLYLGINHKDGKIFMKRMNNDGLIDVKTYSLVTEQTKKTDMQEVLSRLANIEKKIGVANESHVIDVTE